MVAPVSTKAVYVPTPFGKIAAMHGLVLFSSLKNLKLPMRIAPLLPAVIIPA